MKIPLPRRLIATALTVLFSVALGADGLRAQDESDNNSSSANTYDSTGTVVDISAPLTMTVRSRRGPFTYQIDPDVHVYTAARKAGTIRDVRVGQTVTVYYYKRIGLETIARVVILKNASAKK